jgi:uncharacterized protein YdgA (DUF945 family)
MSKFPRLVVTLVLLIALLGFFAAPKAISLAINEDAIDGLIALLPTGPDLRLEVNKQELNRGWFTSTGKLNLNYTIAALEPISIDLDFGIDHGPLLFTDQGLKFGFAYAQINPKISFSDLTVDLNESPGQLDIDMSVIADFSRALNLQFVVSPLSASNQDSAVAFAGLRGSVILRGDQSAQAELTLASFEIGDTPSNQRIEILNASVLAKTAAISSALAPASIEFTIPSINSSLPNPLSIDDLSFTSSVAKQLPSNLITLRQEAKLGAMTGEVPLSAGQWHIELSEINEESLTQFYAMLNRLQLLRNNSTPSAIRETNDLTQRLGLLVLNNPLTLSSAFNVTAYDGSHSGELRFGYNGLPLLRNLMGLNIREAVAASTFSVDLDLDLEAISQSPANEMIDPFVQEGYIVISNGRVKMNANLQNSIVELNGEATPVEQFF